MPLPKLIGITVRTTSSTSILLEVKYRCSFPDTPCPEKVSRCIKTEGRQTGHADIHSQKRQRKSVFRKRLRHSLGIRSSPCKPGDPGQQCREKVIYKMKQRRIDHIFCFHHQISKGGAQKGCGQGTSTDCHERVQRACPSAPPGSIYLLSWTENFSG